MLNAGGAWICAHLYFLFIYVIVPLYAYLSEFASIMCMRGLIYSLPTLLYHYFLLLPRFHLVEMVRNNNNHHNHKN